MHGAQNRVPAGVPTGGRFAASSRAEAGIGPLVPLDEDRDSDRFGISQSIGRSFDYPDDRLDGVDLADDDFDSTAVSQGFGKSYSTRG